MVVMGKKHVYNKFIMLIITNYRYMVITNYGCSKANLMVPRNSL